MPDTLRPASQISYVENGNKEKHPQELWRLCTNATTHHSSSDLEGKGCCVIPGD